MPEDNSSLFASMIGALATKGGEKGVVKDSDGKISPSLTPNEVARYEKIFGIMKKVVNPGPETGQLDKSPSSKVGSTAAMQKAAKVSSGGSGFDMPGLGTIAAIGGAASILGAALTTMSEDFMAKVEKLGAGFVEFGDAAGDELGKLGGLALKVGAKIGLKGLKMIPFIGSFVNFAYGVDHMKKGEYLDGAWEFISGIAGFFPGAGTAVSMLMDGYKIFAEIEANKIEAETGEKPSFGDMLAKQSKELGKIILKKLQAGKIPVLSTLFKFGEGIGHMGTGDFSEGLESWSYILPSLLGGKDSPIYQYVATGLGTIWALTKETGTSAFNKGSEMAGDAWGFMSEVFNSIGNTLKSFFNGVISWIDDALVAGQNAIIDVANKVPFVDIDRVEQGPKKDFFQIDDGVITKDGKVTAINDQDDVLAAKRGGPIDKMLDQNSAAMQSIASINAQQLNVLVEIREGIKSLKSSGGLAFSNTSLTQEFFE